ncbi:unnamed protein product [Lepeophtheirus salmonis]|uniref:(salmon louse) hypothetical protein n=1 Tax=Lepeophtheirus salmonis TaxID=72036 RepID=A0A7R8CWF5_LEPSM|nr:unnamed protein product [Lepeophtheirus salmonis]CAF2921627.1 unnamed protein product [Lepeophtheirus salmonis]
MIQQILLFALLSVVYGDEPTTTYQATSAPTYNSSPSYTQPISYQESPRPYNYEYAVNDEYSGVNYSAQENSDGKVVSGSYTVVLPDGRIQTVTYTVDEYSGYVADVQYQGTPTYPDYEPKSAPAYKLAPDYNPAPVYEQESSYRAAEPSPSYQSTAPVAYEA